MYTDHQALTWVFSPGNRTSNAKMARWAMELSSLQFKVHHKPGTAMGHVDGLSRLPVGKVVALTMNDLLNPDDDAVGPSSVGEHSSPEADEEVEYADRAAGDPADGHVDDPGPVGLREDPVREEVGPVAPSPVDQFSLDREQFVSEQLEVPWIKALVAFLLDGALPLDPYLRARVVRMGPRYSVQEGMLLRRVNLPARAGPARSDSVPVVPLTYVETVLHFCHKDVLSSHMGLTKTTEKVRRHAFWPGWTKDVEEYVRTCSECGGGKGPRPWRSGLIQRMPVADLTGPFSLLVVDAIGPLPLTGRGHRYILVFVDYFTR